MEQKQEIRRILLGNIVRTEDDSLAAAEPGQRLLFQGVRNGWGSARLFGVMQRVRRYVRKDKTNEMSAARSIFRNMGRKVCLKTAPEKEACLCCSLMSAPVLLVAELEKEELRISAFAGRNLLSPISCMWLLNRFEKALPKDTNRVKEAPKKPSVRRKKTAKDKAQKKDEKPRKKS